MAIMVLLFAAIYSRSISKEGFYYKDAILVPQQDNGTTIYSGKLKGKQAVFTVSEDKTVTFQHGDELYGTYAVKES